MPGVPNFDNGPAMLAPIAVALAIVMACVLLVAGRKLSRMAVDVIAIATALALTGLLGYLLATSAGGRIVTWAAGWSPHHGYSVGIAFVVDPLGAGIALLACCLMAIAFLYSVRYLDAVEAHYHCLMLLFLAGMIGFSLTGDLFDLFVFFELMGATAYGLTAIVVEDESALQGGINFGIVNSLGAYFSLAGLGLLFARTGSVGLPQLHVELAHHRPDALIVAAFVLVLIGFLVKGAMVPFHFWLADAHAVAPAPVCLLFSGVMVPLGIYGAFRIYWAVFVPILPKGDVRQTFIVLGAVTAVLGAVMALSQRHFKRLLAYSTIAHVGLFLVALACLSVSGTAGALLYVAGHAAVKGALFLIAGVMLAQYGSVDEYDLYGRGTGQKAMGVALVIGALGLGWATALRYVSGQGPERGCGDGGWVPVGAGALCGRLGTDSGGGVARRRPGVLRAGSEAGRVEQGPSGRQRRGGGVAVRTPAVDHGCRHRAPPRRWVRARIDPGGPQRGQPSRRQLHRLGGIRPPGSLSGTRRHHRANCPELDGTGAGSRSCLGRAGLCRRRGGPLRTQRGNTTAAVAARRLPPSRVLAAAPLRPCRGLRGLDDDGHDLLAGFVGLPLR